MTTQRYSSRWNAEQDARDTMRDASKKLQRKVADLAWAEQISIDAALARLAAAGVDCEGYAHETDALRCSECGGEGTVEVITGRYSDGSEINAIEDCEKCNHGVERCAECGADAFIRVSAERALCRVCAADQCTTSCTGDRETCPCDAHQIWRSELRIRR